MNNFGFEVLQKLIHVHNKMDMQRHLNIDSQLIHIATMFPTIDSHHMYTWTNWKWNQQPTNCLI